MKHYLRKVFFILFFLFMLSIERSIGLPLFSFLFATILFFQFNEYQKIAIVVFSGMLLAVAYSVPFAVGVGVMAFLLLGVESSETFFQQQGLKVFTVILLCAASLAFFLQFDFTLFQIVYHLGVIVTLFSMIQTWGYYQRPSTSLR